MSDPEPQSSSIRVENESEIPGTSVQVRVAVLEE